MSGAADASTATTSAAANAAAASSSSSTAHAGAQSASSASTSQTRIINEDQDDDEDDDDEEEEDDDDDDASAQAAGLNAKQRKKKKAKAAAKLRKKLGLGSSSKVPAADPDEKLLASGSSRDGKISDEVVSQVQQAVHQEHGSAAANAVTKANLAKVMAMMNLERDAMLKSQESKQKTQKAIADHKFWKTQPVMKPTDAPVVAPAEEGSIEPSVAPDQVRQQPYPLPADFAWVQIDVDDAAELKEVYDLLSANYVEDDDATFRFDYSPEFLHWVLKHPATTRRGTLACASCRPTSWWRSSRASRTSCACATRRTSRPRSTFCACTRSCAPSGSRPC